MSFAGGLPVSVASKDQDERLRGTMGTQVPVSEGIFSWPSAEPHLIGSRCTNCGNHMFPTQSGCPKCTANETETVELARRGTLWTWTVQGFPPKAPPFAGATDPREFK